ncbi:MAG: hypothetical protein GWP59_01525 [Chlamydiales bacterium]|nr:hypothetical protein [Chlamydiales bacterium]NCF70359.1 hypothetical protein [Chlamydiales bacterium]
MNQKISLSNYLSYASVRCFGFIVSILPLRAIRYLAKLLAPMLCLFYSSAYKQVMSNLSLAKKLNLSLTEKKQLCEKSFENLVIVLLEYFKVKQYKTNLSRLAHCENPEKLDELIQKFGSVVFVSGHQANWELPFLYITKRYPAAAVGTPVKNPLLYKWILSIREMFQGTLIPPKNAVRNCVNFLEKNISTCLVFDQAYPDSDYSYPLLGCRAWTTLGPAIIAYRSKKPLVMITIKRKKSQYFFKFHDPIFTDSTKDIRQACPEVMEKLMNALELQIMKCPEQWLWQHNRWKQVGVNFIPRKFRFNSVLIILPEGTKNFYTSLKALKVLQSIYERAFIKIFIPSSCLELNLEFDPAIVVETYNYTKDILVEDWQSQIVFDFSDKESIKKHYLSRSASQVINNKDIEDLASQHKAFSQASTIEQKITLALSRK